jgi:hypothetical protein
MKKRDFTLLFCPRPGPEHHRAHLLLRGQQVASCWITRARPSPPAEPPRCGSSPPRAGSSPGQPASLSDRARQQGPKVLYSNNSVDSSLVSTSTRLSTYQGCVTYGGIPRRGYVNFQKQTRVIHHVRKRVYKEQNGLRSTRNALYLHESERASFTLHFQEIRDIARPQIRDATDGLVLQYRACIVHNWEASEDQSDAGHNSKIFHSLRQYGNK